MDPQSIQTWDAFTQTHTHIHTQTHAHTPHTHTHADTHTRTNTHFLAHSLIGEGVEMESKWIPRRFQTGVTGNGAEIASAASERSD